MNYHLHNCFCDNLNLREHAITYPYLADTPHDYTFMYDFFGTDGALAESRSILRYHRDYINLIGWNEGYLNAEGKLQKYSLQVPLIFRFITDAYGFAFHAFNHSAIWDYVDVSSTYLKSLHPGDHRNCRDIFTFKLEFFFHSCVNLIYQAVLLIDSFIALNFLDEFHTLMGQELLKQNAAETLHRFNNAYPTLYPQEVFDEVTQNFDQDKKNKYIETQKFTKTEFDDLRKKQTYIIICKTCVLGLSTGFTLAALLYFLNE